MLEESLNDLGCPKVGICSASQNEYGQRVEIAGYDLRRKRLKSCSETQLRLRSSDANILKSKADGNQICKCGVLVPIY